MAKVSFTKLGLKLNQDIKTIEWNGQNIEIKQYLPINDKLQIITNILNNAEDDSKFANPVKVLVFLHLEMLYNYTNINFTDKQKEDPSKLFDICASGGLIDTIIDAIPVEEYDFLVDSTNKIVKAIYKYHNSVLGVLEAVFNDYNETNLNISELASKLTDPEALNMLKEILPLTE